MISKMTPAQEKNVPVYFKKWEAVGYRTKTVDRKKAKAAVDFLYEKIMKIEKPKYVIFLDSPMACQLACNLLKGTKFDATQLGSQLRSQLRSQLGSQLRSQLRSQLDSQKLKYFSWGINNWWWTGYYAFYDFVLNELLPEKKGDFKLFQSFLEPFQELHFMYPFKEIAFVSDFPKAIHTNERFQLHKDGGAALEYRDSYALYKLNGITVSKELAEVSPDQITKEMITKETNADTRREVVRKLGSVRLEKLIQPKVIDKFEEYDLISFDIGDGRRRPHIRMKCPSTGLTHILGVRPEINTCTKALAALFNQEVWKRPILEDGLIRGGDPESFEDGQVLYRHGDVNLKKYSGEILEVKNPLSKGIIHKGNNNNHEYESGFFEVQDVSGKRILVVLDDSTIGHNEHGNQVTPPGSYEIDIAREYDHFLEESRQVID